MTLFGYGLLGPTQTGRSFPRLRATPVRADDNLIELTGAELEGVAGGTGRTISGVDAARRIAIDASND